MPGTAGDSWGGPDVDFQREDTIQRLLPGDQGQPFYVTFGFYPGAAQRSFQLTRQIVVGTAGGAAFNADFGADFDIS